MTNTTILTAAGAITLDADHDLVDQINERSESCDHDPMEGECYSGCGMPITKVITWDESLLGMCRECAHELRAAECEARALSAYDMDYYSGYE